MAEKIVKVCDRCKTECVLFDTAMWKTVTFHKLKLGKPEGESIVYDLCKECASALKMEIIDPGLAK